MIPPAPPARAGLARAVERLARLWALLGGAVILAVVGVNLLEVLGAAARPWLGWRFTGAVELTEMGVAVAAFAFLPWCQITGANVSADIFTSRAGPRTVAVLRLAAAAVALAFAALLMWRMGLGLADQRAFRQATTILAVPVWWAFVPIVASLGLLVACAAVTMVEAGRAAVRGA